MTIAKVNFGEWLPDVPAHENPGLVVANNVEWLDGAYRGRYFIHGATGLTSALPSRPRGAISVTASSGTIYTYVGTDVELYVRNSTSWDSRSPGTYTTGSSDFWRFAQFDELLIATNYADVPKSITIGSGSDFATLALTGTAPKARVIGVVGRHVVLGDIDNGSAIPYRIQWCRIDDPTEWPVVGSADALAKQSGAQDMPSRLGAVTGIVGNDQFGIVIQERGVSRMTYVGGDLVYQFDEIDSVQGCAYPNSIVKVGDLAYYLGQTGLCVTDGVSVKNLSTGKFNTYLNSINDTYKDRVCGAFDVARNLLYFAFPTSAATGGRPNKVLVYNIASGRATSGDDQIECLFQTLSADGFTYSQSYPQLYAFNSSNELAFFISNGGSLGVSTQIETGQIEINPGQYTFISGVKLVGSDALATVALGKPLASYSPASTTTYTSETSINQRSGFAGFRLESRYVRARFTFTPNFGYATGLEVDQIPGGYA